MLVFLVLVALEPIYIILKIVQIQLVPEYTLVPIVPLFVMGLLTCICMFALNVSHSNSIFAAVLALSCRAIVIFLWVQVYRNFGRGLKPVLGTYACISPSYNIFSTHRTRHLDVVHLPHRSPLARALW